MNLKGLCKLLSELFELSVFFVNSSGEVLFELLGDRVLNPLYRNDKHLFFASLEFDPTIRADVPLIQKTDFFENYILMSIVTDNKHEGTVILGPSLPFTLLEHRINGIINDTVIFAHREQVFHYYKSVPIISHEDFLNIAVLAHHMFNRQLIETENVIYNLLSSDPKKEKKIMGALRTRKNQEEAPHHDPLNEKKLLTIVREGQVDALKDFNQLEIENTGILSKSSLIRSKKNLGIIGISLATRAAIDGGLHSEIAFSVSDIYIQRLEDLRTVNEIDQLIMEGFITLTEKVSQVKEAQHSKTVTLCKNYIYNQRYAKITREEIADIVAISPNYLSVLFKKEVGIPVNEYIQQIKIEEAKNLIQYSNTPLSEVGSILNFADQSYFTKIFKKHAGMSPKQFQQLHHLLQE